MKLKVVYNDNCENLISNLKEFIKDYPLIELEIFHENILKERKKAFGLKSEWGTRLSPFAILIDNENPIKAFYSDVNECTIDNISKVLKSFIPYESASN